MAQQQTQPYSRAVAITLSDTVNFDGSTFAANAATEAIPCEAIAIGTTGNVVVVAENGAATAIAVTVGQILPFKAIRINSTGSTASSAHVALYTA